MISKQQDRVLLQESAEYWSTDEYIITGKTKKVSLYYMMNKYGLVHNKALYVYRLQS